MGDRETASDTGHGGDAHVRNLIRRFVEAGVPGYRIEDQKPGCKKCGHQAGEVLVPVDEHLKRLNAARLQLDGMGAPGILIARTDAEAGVKTYGRAVADAMTFHVDEGQAAEEAHPRHRRVDVRAPGMRLDHT